MNDGSAEYREAIGYLGESYRKGLRAFAKWCAEHWKITVRDAWSADLSPDYIAGYNAAMEAVDAALDAFMEEYGP